MRSQIASISTGPVRQSNMELLRIVAMFLVLVTHADFWSLGSPNYDEIHSSFWSASTRIFFEAISIICVNVFILISGWFNIKPSLKGFGNFIFQCLYINATIYIIALLFGISGFSKSAILDVFFLSDSDWFVKSYIGLYIISPILNIYCKEADKRTQEYVLLSFFVFQTVFGMTNTAKFISGGYSTFSFIGLYLLGNYAHKHLYHKWQNRYLIPITFLMLTINEFIYEARIGIPINVGVSIMTYINPLVIAGSLGLCIVFAQIHIAYSKFINTIGKSAFAVFLIHFNPNINSCVFKTVNIYIYDNYVGLSCLFLLLIWLCLVFVICIIYDQPRRWIWDEITKHLPAKYK